MLKMSKGVFATVKAPSRLPNRVTNPPRVWRRLQMAKDRLRAGFLHHLVDSLGTAPTESSLCRRCGNRLCLPVSSQPRETLFLHSSPVLDLPNSLWLGGPQVGDSHSFFRKKKKKEFPCGPKRRELKAAWSFDASQIVA